MEVKEGKWKWKRENESKRGKMGVKEGKKGLWYANKGKWGKKNMLLFEGRVADFHGLGVMSLGSISKKLFNHLEIPYISISRVI